MRGGRNRERQAREEEEKRAAAAERQRRKAILKTIETIATTLGETEPRLHKQIVHVVEIMGMEEAQEIFEDAQRVEAEGGMLTIDGTRRRTPGGVFHVLVKRRLTETGRKAEIKKI
ncbi:MAG: hypothetical protein EI684_02950 [Candidatus Viridilinea halotolerans]|uniref:Phosphorylated adapter RNA export protein n=1 Tax=Candidatus Viridilinea halotolerans TaxID=2491704 RepID=A0A426U8P6_9CHLR|nr:MAG: hypothetical protein EI684_02950 [Candidatus Viridilinea halotolerans]